jgi:hypothetical protein
MLQDKHFAVGIQCVYIGRRTYNRLQVCRALRRAFNLILLLIGLVSIHTAKRAAVGRLQCILVRCHAGLHMY